jgi:parvulin-like peptidyl-prolyl isomerase
MTLRAKPAGPRARRPRWEDEGRRTLLVTIAFGLVVVLAVGILGGVAAYSWYDDTYGVLVTVNGAPITKSDLRTRLAIELFRIDETMARIRDEVAAGRISQADGQSQEQSLQSQRNQADQIALSDLVDVRLISQLAAQQGITVTDQEIDAQLVKEATRPEQRHAWMIAVAPEVSPGADGPTEAQKAAAKAKADQAAADLAAGKAWEDVAKTVSSDPSGLQGGDLGWIGADDPYLDPAFVKALFAAPLKTPTPVVEGSDGIYRIGRVTEIAPAQTDPAFQEKIRDAGIDLAAYREAVRADLLREKLQEAIVHQVVDTPTLQRHVSEIYVADQSGAGDQVRVRHILYAPKGDPQAAASLAPDDPAWAAAEAKAQAAYNDLKALAGDPAALEAAFIARAKAESDDSGTKADGGLLPWSTRGSLDRAFGDAVFAPNLSHDQLLPPVKSSYGWHVILFLDRRPPAEERIRGAQLRAAAATGITFGAIAADVSEGPNAQQGGDIGWVARYQLPKTLEDAIFAAPVGGLSQVVHVNGDGWYLFKVWAEERRLPQGDQADQLRQRAFTTWYQEQKSKAQIVYVGAAASPTPPLQ